LGEYSNQNVFVKNNNYIQNETVKNFLLKDNKKYFNVKTLEEAYKQGVRKIKIGIHK
jgi:hypothetical protein